jgi:hypothetical protein
MVNEALVNHKKALGLTDEERRRVREEQLRQQEALLEQTWLSYCAAKGAVEALRRELDGE